MTKRQLIDDIRRLNRSAAVEFLAEFDENELWSYLQRLLAVKSRHQREDILQPLTSEEISSL